jgi:hypothetical protein
VRGRVAAKSIGLFAYDQTLDGNGIRVNCEVRVFPLLVRRQSETWPEIEQRVVQWVAPDRALTLIKDPALKALVAAFIKRTAVAASESTPGTARAPAQAEDVQMASQMLLDSRAQRTAETAPSIRLCPPCEFSHSLSAREHP